MIKKTMAAILIILLLPYFITNFFSGDVTKEYSLQRATKDFISIRDGKDIREISFEDYVMGVTARQIDMGMHLETIKAQTLIVRTSLKKQLQDLPGELLSEEYMTLDEMQRKGILDKLSQAAEATKGQVLTYEGNLVAPPYHATSSGKTRSGEVLHAQTEYGWLVGVPSEQDVEDERYLHIEMLSENKLRKSISAALQGSLKGGELLEQIEVMARDESNYVLQVQVGDEIISGERFREILGLNSSCFYIEKTDKKIRVTTKGVGHGLGLSQFGANKLSQAGQSYVEILQYYFPKCIIA